MKRTMLWLALITAFWPGVARGQSGHSDLVFWYEAGSIRTQSGNGLGVGTGRFATSGIFQQFENNPGFASEIDAGHGIGPGDIIVYNVLGDLYYWDGDEFAVPAAGTQIRIENNGAPDTIIGVGTGLQPGGFAPFANPIGQADGGGDFHSHVNYFLEPNFNPTPAPPPALGAYGLKLSLSTDEPGIADSAPFFVAFNFGLSTGDFAEAVEAFSGLLTSGLAGDYNGNDTIDSADYTVWRDTLSVGSSSLLNDPTPGSVDESDFLYWRSHFGESLGGGSVAAAPLAGAVPEPASGVLLLVGGLLVATLQWKGGRPMPH